MAKPPTPLDQGITSPVRPALTPAPLLTGRAKALVVVMTLTSSVIVFFVLYYVHRNFAGCHEPNCMDVGNDFEAIMDTKADPCQDFYQFVCGNFEIAYPSSISYLSVIELRMREAYRAMLEMHQESSKPTVIESTILAFRRCMQDYKDQVDDVAPLQRLYRDLQGMWTQKSSNKSEANILGFLMLLSLRYGTPVFLKVNLTQDLQMPRNLVLQLEIQDAGPPPDRMIIENILRRVLEDVQWVIGKDTSKIVFNIMTLFSKALAKVSTRDRNPAFMRIRDIGIVYGEVTPDEFIQISSLLPLSSNTRFKEAFFTTNMVGLIELSKLLETVNPEHFITTTLFILIEKLTPITTFKIADIYGTSTKTAFQMRQNTCSEFSLLLLPRVTEHMFIREWLQHKASDAPRVMFTDVVNSFRLVKPYSQMSTTTLSELHKVLTATQTVFGSIPGHDTRAALQKRHKGVTSADQKSTFVEWVLEVLKLEAKFSLESTNTKQKYPADIYSTDLSPGVLYDSMFRYLQVLPGRLLPPLRLGSSTLKAISYGQLGTAIAGLLAQSVHPSDPFLHRHVQGLSTLADLNISMKCISKSRFYYTGQYADKDGVVKDWASHVGLHVAFKAYSNSTPKKEAKRPYVPGVDSGWQAFFVASCLLGCQAASKTEAFTADAKCNLPVMHSADFAKAFHCASNSRMNPVAKCD